MIFAGPLRSLDPQKKITQYTLNTWKTERGLPNNTVLAIVQDRSGYLWLGTAEGLVRFDGVNFTVFNSNNTPEFHDRFVNNLYIDRRGTLWIGTIRGKLLSLEQGRLRRHFLASDISGMALNCIAEDGRGDLWVGTSKVCFADRPQNAAFQKHPSFPGIKILCLETDRSGRLLVSTTSKGLYRLEKEQWRRVLSVTGELGSDIYVLKHDRDGSLWLGTGIGLYRLSRRTRRTIFSSAQGLTATHVCSG